MHDRVWPVLAGDSLAPTVELLFRWSQIIGKIRMELTPARNHWWHVPLYVTSSGLSTSAMPVPAGNLTIELDLRDHRLSFDQSDGHRLTLPLRSEPVAAFYGRVRAALDLLGVDVEVWTVPVECEDRTPLDQDVRPRLYDPAQAGALWRALVCMTPVFDRFASDFVGKTSPLHFFWGAFDLAQTRFSGRTAPLHPGAPNLARRVVREAYSHEVSSAGFWPGSGPQPEPAFYAYAYPEPAGYREAPVLPVEAHYHPQLHEFVLPYAAVQRADEPEAALRSFLESTYAAAADRGRWDRAALERGRDDDPRA